MSFLGVTVNFITQNLKSKHLNSSSQTGFSEGMRENISTYSGPKTPDLPTALDPQPLGLSMIKPATTPLPMIQ